MNADHAAKIKADQKLCDIDLKTDKGLSLEKLFNQKEALKYPKPTFEQDEKNFDWNKKEFNEPRRFTVKNIRDIFYSLLNLSKAQERLCDGELNIKNLWDKCQSLTEECQRIDERLTQNRKEVDETHEEHVARFEDTQAQNEDQFAIHDDKLAKINKKLEEHKSRHEEHGNIQGKLQRECDKLNRLITKNKE